MKNDTLKPLFLLLVVLLFLFLGCSERVHVPMGQTAVIYDVRTDSLSMKSEGDYVISMYEKIHLYETKVQKETFSFTCLTKGDREVRVDIDLHFHPKEDSLISLHKTFGPEYVARFVVAQTRAIVRNEFSKMSGQDIHLPNVESRIIDAIQDEDSYRGFIVIDHIRITDFEYSVLMQKAYKEGIESFVKDLRSENQEERILAAKALLKNNSETAIEILLIHYSFEKDPEVRSVIRLGLAK